MTREKKLPQFYVLLGILLAGFPLFFDVYRITSFNIVPHDDYAPYLLYLLGETGGEIPDSPTGYRLLSVLIAVPFYFLLPLFKFSYLEGQSDTYLKALEALSFVTYLVVSTGSFLIYCITKNRYAGGQIISILAALISLLLFRFTAIYSIDPTAIMIICLIILYLENKWIFSVLLLLSVGFNEKVVFLFVMLFGARLIFRQSIKFADLAISCFAFLLYFILRSIIDLPGHEYMMQPWMFAEKAKHTLGLLFTPKSVFLNWLPGIISFGLFYMAFKEFEKRENISPLLFSKVDFFPIIGFLIIAIITDMQYTIGRILLFCFPLYLPLATLFIERYFEELKFKH